ncbi:MAG: hypothetical protein ACD_79C00252G0015 [uncultured bacterium]|nr:MAG: hypothetical protein ACD_79C00252G0015 [uncultured bacterium]
MKLINRQKQNIFRITACFIGFFIFLLLMESISRFYLYVRKIDNNNKKLSYLNLVDLYYNENKYLLIPHPYLPFVPRKGYSKDNVFINQFNLKNPEINLVKEKDVIRIINLGGSTTWNSEVKMEETYSALMEKKLNAIYGEKRKFEVVNAGVTNYNSLDSLVLLVINLIRLKPDIITFYGAVNDAPFFRYDSDTISNDYSHLYKDMEYDRILIFDFIPQFFEKSYFYLIIRKFILKRFFPERLSSYIAFKTEVYEKGNRNIFNEEMAERIYGGNLTVVAKICKGYGMHLILSTFHYDGQANHEIDYLNEIIRKVSIEEQILLIDNARLLQKNQGIHISDNIHFTLKGNYEMAKNFVDKIMNIYNN